MRQRAAASLLYQSKYAEAAFRNLLKLIFLKIVGRILAFYNHREDAKHYREAVEHIGKPHGTIGKQENTYAVRRMRRPLMPM